MPKQCCKDFFAKMLRPENEAEPVFCLRAQDALAPSALRLWIELAVRGGAPAEKVARAVEHLREIEAWQKANPDRVKVPD